MLRIQEEYWVTYHQSVWSHENCKFSNILIIFDLYIQTTFYMQRSKRMSRLSNMTSENSPLLNLDQVSLIPNTLPSLACCTFAVMEDLLVCKTDLAV